MNIYFPRNIFTELIGNSFSEQMQEKVEYFPGAMVTNEILKDKNSVGLIPTFDLIKHKELFISKSFGVSFESDLCNSYLYFLSQGKDIKSIYLSGDVTSNEAVGAKLILKELYSTEVELNLLTEGKPDKGKNVLLVGDNNFNEDRFINGLSFAEEIIEVLSLPYVNYVLASTDKSAMENFHKSISDTQTKIYNLVEEENFGKGLSSTARATIREGIASFICKFDEQDIQGIEQLLRLPFYHEIISDIVQINFVY